ncbi:DUF2332 family protein, partial [Paracoccus sp. APAP_BH8]|uniref:DUF2332 family protein n=1 Tax=Paracoccus sp. APAP_BH8 TaxID=3110237 RepID=UPI002FD7F1F8
LNPLDPARDGLRLLSYIWPDQRARLERMQAALALAERYPPRDRISQAWGKRLQKHHEASHD